jgi:hypothetical protein
VQNAIAGPVPLTAFVVQTFKHLREFLEIFESLKVALFYFLLFFFHAGDLITPLEKAQVKMGNL